MRASSLQTGLSAGPLGSPVGQHRSAPAAVVREEQEAVRLYTPRYGSFEIRARVSDDAAAMGALWMLGYEDAPRAVGGDLRLRGLRPLGAPGPRRRRMGVHPFGDPRITDEFAARTLPVDARELPVFAVEWTREDVAFSVDGEPVATVHQSPDYPMQFVLDVYALPGPDRAPPAGPSPEELVVDGFRGYRPAGTPPRRP